MDDFVTNYKYVDSSKSEGECSEFNADDTLWSKTRQSKLLETVLFDSVCMNEVPLKI